jgi:hypothetical protein
MKKLKFGGYLSVIMTVFLTMMALPAMTTAAEATVNLGVG